MPRHDQTYANQQKAAAILEKLFPQHRTHPGIAHYLIHAYDYTSRAPRGLPAAKAYAKMSPWVPHALHMPSHIFTRLGMWAESIDSNAASAAAARDYAAQYHPGATSFEELHALDYLTYAYLQTGQDKKAKEVVDRLGEITKTYPDGNVAVAYAFGAIPARYALERRQWTEAVSLVRRPAPFWPAFPFAEAHIEFARAIGGARGGNLAEAQRAVVRLKALKKAIKKPNARFFAQQVNIQHMAAYAWILHAGQRNDEALAMLAKAADLEDALGKHPVSPGAIFPVRELLGDLLLELDRPADAFATYEASLKIYPERLTGIYGAARAAELAGMSKPARAYYEKVVSLTRNGDGTRAEIVSARAFLAKGTSADPAEARK